MPSKAMVCLGLCCTAALSVHACMCVRERDTYM